MNKKLSKNISILIMGVLLLCIPFSVTAEPTVGKILNIKLLNQDPNPARVGDINILNFVAENLGDTEIKNLQVEILPEYPFTSIESQNTKSLGNIYAYQNNQHSIFFSYKIMIDKNVKAGSYELKLRYTHDNSPFTEISVPIEISNKEYAQISNIDKSTLLPGKEENLTFTITNSGNAPLKNMVFTWSETNGVILPVHSDNIKYIKYLDAGNSVDLVYTVIANVDATPGLYKLDLSLNYESDVNTTTHVLNTKSGIFVGGETDFDVAFSQSSAGQTSLSVANIGNTQALSVLVRIPQQQNYRVSGSNSAIIGNLDKGDYTLVSFQITQNNGTLTRNGNFSRNNNGQQPNQQQPQFNESMRGNFSRQFNQDGLRVLIDYTDTTGQRKSVEKIVSIQFRDQTSSIGQMRSQTQTSSFFNSTPFYIIMAILVFIGVYYGYKKFTKKK